MPVSLVELAGLDLLALWSISSASRATRSSHKRRSAAGQGYPSGRAVERLSGIELPGLFLVELVGVGVLVELLALVGPAAGTF